VARTLLETVGVPLAAPSANRFGRISPTSAKDVEAELGDRIQIIIDGGACEVGVESTVVALGTDGELTLLRPGGVPAAEIESVIGVKLRLPSDSSRPQGPGMLKSHYAPRKKLELLPAPLQKLSQQALVAISQRFGRDQGSIRSIGFLLFSGSAEEQRSRLSELAGNIPFTIRTLSTAGDLEEAARNLFSELRFLDDSEAELLIAEPCAEITGLGHAISDRLRRAAAERK
jgi:L-threonylcarbamoyladenylate synthase